MTRQCAHSYSYTGIVILLSREGSGGRLGAGHPLLYGLHRDGSSYTATIRGLSAGTALATVLRFQMRAAFSPKTFALISSVSLGYPCPSTSRSGVWNFRNPSICHWGVPQRAVAVPHL